MLGGQGDLGAGDSWELLLLLGLSGGSEVTRILARE